VAQITLIQIQKDERKRPHYVRVSVFLNGLSFICFLCKLILGITNKNRLSETLGLYEKFLWCEAPDTLSVAFRFSQRERKAS
jgi:hypothetical protein